MTGGSGLLTRTEGCVAVEGQGDQGGSSSGPGNGPPPLSGRPCRTGGVQFCGSLLPPRPSTGEALPLSPAPARARPEVEARALRVQPVLRARPGAQGPPSQPCPLTPPRQVAFRRGTVLGGRGPRARGRAFRGRRQLLPSWIRAFAPCERRVGLAGGGLPGPRPAPSTPVSEHGLLVGGGPLMSGLSSFPSRCSAEGGPPRRGLSLFGSSHRVAPQPQL